MQSGPETCHHQREKQEREVGLQPQESQDGDLGPGLEGLTWFQVFATTPGEQQRTPHHSWEGKPRLSLLFQTVTVPSC